MTIRRTITYCTVAAGIIISAVGLWLAGRTDSLHSAEVFLALGIACMAGAGVYSLAMDDAQARARMLGSEHRVGEGRTIDLTTPAPVATDVDQQLLV